MEGACTKSNLTPEMEVPEIILTKISRLCQLSSQRGFLSRLQIFKSIGPIGYGFLLGGGGGSSLIKSDAKFRIRNKL
jgi:hypothetical protein